VLVGSMLGSVCGGCGGGLRGRVPRVHACQLAVSSPVEGGAGKRKKDKGKETLAHIPELCVTTPFCSCSSLRRAMAWNAPRALNAPTFW
jgi:hypothetical protein